MSPLLGDTFHFDYLKSEREVQLPNGVFLYLERPVYIPLVFSDPDVLDIALPNGNHKEGTFSTLSYVTNEVVRQDGSTWSDPPARLPRSETEGDAVLDFLGNTLANVPPRSQNTDSKLLIYRLFQKGRVLAQDGSGPPAQAHTWRPQRAHRRH